MTCHIFANLKIFFQKDWGWHEGVNPLRFVCCQEILKNEKNPEKTNLIFQLEMAGISSLAMT